METQGRKEVAEAVLIAAFCQIAVELVAWSVSTFKARQTVETESKRKGKKGKRK